MLHFFLVDDQKHLENVLKKEFLLPLKEKQENDKLKYPTERKKPTWLEAYDESTLEMKNNHSETASSSKFQNSSQARLQQKSKNSNMSKSQNDSTRKKERKRKAKSLKEVLILLAVNLKTSVILSYY